MRRSYKMVPFAPLVAIASAALILMPGRVFGQVRGTTGGSAVGGGFTGGLGQTSRGGFTGGGFAGTGFTGGGFAGGLQGGFAGFSGGLSNLGGFAGGLGSFSGGIGSFSGTTQPGASGAAMMGANSLFQGLTTSRLTNSAFSSNRFVNQSRGTSRTSQLGSTSIGRLAASASRGSLSSINPFSNRGTTGFGLTGRTGLSQFGGLNPFGQTARGGVTGRSTTSTTSRMAVSYQVQIDLPPAASAASELQANLQGAISRIPSLAGLPPLVVAVEGSTVVLRGNVPSDRDKRLAEAIARLQPGVRSVRNEIAVVPPKNP